MLKETIQLKFSSTTVFTQLVFYQQKSEKLHILKKFFFCFVLFLKKILIFKMDVARNKFIKIYNEIVIYLALLGKIRSMKLSYIWSHQFMTSRKNSWFLPTTPSPCHTRVTIGFPSLWKSHKDLSNPLLSLTKT